MDERVLYGTKNTTILTNLHNTTTSTTYSLRQSTPTCFQALSTPSGLRIFTTTQNKALLHIYNIQNSQLNNGVGGGSMSSSSHAEVNISQRIPLVEPMEKFIVYQDKYLFGTSVTGGGIGGLYIWDLESGELLKFHQGLHYQKINGFVLSEDGKFLITYSDDSRCCVWEIRDLFSNNLEKLKPVSILKDHSLPITNVEVVGDFIFTGSLDMSIRCYGWMENGFSQLKVFTFHQRVFNFKLDSALRCIYAVLEKSGSGTSVIMQVPLFYKLSLSSTGDSNEGNDRDLRIVNLLNSSQSHKIYTCTPFFEKDDEQLKNRIKNFQMNGLVICSKIYEGLAVSKLQINLDNTILLVGLQKYGKILCMDIFSKQILKELNSNDQSDILDIQIEPIIKKSNELNTSSGSSKDSDVFKYPNLNKNLNDVNEFGDLNVMRVAANSTSPNAEDHIVLNDFESYVDEYVNQSQYLFQNGSAFTIAPSSSNSNTNIINNDAEKDNKIKDLQETVEKLTKAYKDLRTLYSDES